MAHVFALFRYDKKNLIYDSDMHACTILLLYFWCVYSIVDGTYFACIVVVCAEGVSYFRVTFHSLTRDHRRVRLMFLLSAYSKQFYVYMYILGS